MEDLVLIACVSSNLGIGQSGDLIWHIPADMQFFKQTTMGHPVIMGRKTFDSIGRPLPGRQNIVLSHRAREIPGVSWHTSQETLDRYLGTLPGSKFIIGGASLYRMYLDRAASIYLTEVAVSRPADEFFPEFDKSKYQRRVIRADKHDGIKYEIVEYVRK